MELYELTLTKAHEKLKTRTISSLELTRSVLSRITQVEPRVGAYITLTPESALEQAHQADEEISQGRIGRFSGIPMAVKDFISTRGIKTTCASRILENYIPPFNATIMNRLRTEGMILLGKTNLDEFAMGSSTENSALKTTHNPWNLDYIPGGSSGGSAAAVAAGECLAAIGSV